MLKCAVAGLGGLGKVHLKNLCLMENTTKAVEVCGIYDPDPKCYQKKVTTNLGENKLDDLSRIAHFTSLDELIEQAKPDFLLSAAPTFAHEEVAIKALRCGIHTFTEKPMALDADACQRMLQAAQDAGKLLMVGHCLRYWPAYQKLREIICSEEYGRVVRAEFTRLSPLPVWSHDGWMEDFHKSGGAALDLHIHDTDMVQWLFGMPESVTSHATHHRTRFDSISTVYGYPDKLVTATGDWGMYGSYPFHMVFLVRLERATVEYAGNRLSIYTDKETIEPKLAEKDAYYAEIEDFIQCIRDGLAIELNPPEDSVRSVRIVQAEMRSAESGKTVIF